MEGMGFFEGYCLLIRCFLFRYGFVLVFVVY